MEIIKKGTPRSEQIWESICYSCDSILQAKARELSINSDMRNGEYATGTCPVCGAETVFYKKKDVLYG